MSVENHFHFKLKDIQINCQGSILYIGIWIIEFDEEFWFRSIFKIIIEHEHYNMNANKRWTWRLQFELQFVHQLHEHFILQNQVAKTSFLEIIIRMCTPINITFYYYLQIFGRNSLKSHFLWIRIPIQGSKYFQR